MTRLPSHGRKGLRCHFTNMGNAMTNYVSRVQVYDECYTVEVKYASALPNPLIGSTKTKVSPSHTVCAAGCQHRELAILYREVCLRVQGGF